MGAMIAAVGTGLAAIARHITMAGITTFGALAHIGHQLFHWPSALETIALVVAAIHIVHCLIAWARWMWHLARLVAVHTAPVDKRDELEFVITRCIHRAA